MFNNRVEFQAPLSAAEREKCSLMDSIHSWAETNRPVAWVRYVSALTWTFIMFRPLYGQGFTVFTVDSLRYVLMTHHSLAALGLDEGWGLQVTH